MKYTTALDSRQSTMAHTTTNQKQAAATERRRGVWRGGATSRTRGGSAIPLFWGRFKLNNWYKLLKLLLSLVTICFLASLCYLVKPSHTALGQPLPQRLQGWGSWECKKPCRRTGDQLHHGDVLCWMVRLLSTICLYYSYVANATVC